MSCRRGYPRGLRFAVPLVEMPTYLPYLHEEVMRAGGTQVTRRIAGLDEVLDLGPDVIVNAGGSGSSRVEATPIEPHRRPSTTTAVPISERRPPQRGLLLGQLAAPAKPTSTTSSLPGKNARVVRCLCPCRRCCCDGGQADI